MHTIVSGSEDGKIIFWNGYSGIAMTKIEKNFASIHCMSMTRDGRLIVGSSDRTISIYKISYVESAHYGRKVFAEVNLDAIIEDSC